MSTESAAARHHYDVCTSGKSLPRLLHHRQVASKASGPNSDRSNPLTRRNLLIGAGVGALGLVASNKVGRLATGADMAYAAASSADWVDLSRSIRGSLLMPDSPDYPVARLAWNTIYDDVFPQAVLLAADASDVQKAITFCQDLGIRPVPRSGGHSFQGFSTGTGLIIDLSRLNRVQLRADRERASIGAGAQLIDIYARLFTQHRMAIPGGTCPLVGISGLTQGGGIGPFSRQYGLTLDRLLGAEIVTADGRRRWVDAGNEPDLFWAIRGGGGGNFGIVTSFTFAPVPADMTLNSVTLTFAWRDAARVLAAFQEWPEVLPRTAHPDLVLVTSGRAPNAQPTATVTLWDRGPRQKADAAVRHSFARWERSR